MPDTVRHLLDAVPFLTSCESASDVAPDKRATDASSPALTEITVTRQPLEAISW